MPTNALGPGAMGTLYFYFYFILLASPYEQWNKRQGCHNSIEPITLGIDWAIGDTIILIFLLSMTWGQEIVVHRFTDFSQRWKLSNRVLKCDVLRKLHTNPSFFFGRPKKKLEGFVWSILGITGLRTQRQFAAKCSFLASRPLGHCSFRISWQIPYFQKFHFYDIITLVLYYGSLHVEFWTQFPKISMYFHVYFGAYFFTSVFRTCISHVVSMQYGRFTHKKHACNAAMPMACTFCILQSKAHAFLKKWFELQVKKTNSVLSGHQIQYSAWIQKMKVHVVNYCNNFSHATGSHAKLSMQPNLYYINTMNH